MNAQDIGARLARKVFEHRGNHTEVHLREQELALLLTGASEVAESQRVTMVYTVMGESNDHGDGGDTCGWLEGIYATKELAEAAREALIAAAKADGLIVYSALDEDEEEDDWGRDYEVNAVQVITDLSTVTTGRHCGHTRPMTETDCAECVAREAERDAAPGVRFAIRMDDDGATFWLHTHAFGGFIWKIDREPATIVVHDARAEAEAYLRRAFPTADKSMSVRRVTDCPKEG